MAAVRTRKKSTPDETPAVETPETPETPADETPADSPVGLVIEKSTDDLIDDLAVLAVSAFSDGSSFADGAWDAESGIPAIIETASEKLAPWFENQTAADAAVVIISDAGLAIRRLVLSPDGVTPDYAGNTFAYQQAYDKRIRAMALEAFGESAWGRLKSAISTYQSAHQVVLHAVIADAVAADETLAAKTTKVGGQEITLADFADRVVREDKSVNGVKLPAALKSAVKAGYRAQKNADGETLANYRETPETVGMRKRKKSTRTPATPAAAWEQIGADIDAGKLAVLESMIEYGYVTSTMSDSLLGKPSEAAPEIADKENVLKLAQDILKLWTATVHALETGERDAVAAVRRERPKK